MAEQGRPVYREMLVECATRAGRPCEAKEWVAVLPAGMPSAVRGEERTVDLFGDEGSGGKSLSAPGFRELGSADVFQIQKY